MILYQPNLVGESAAAAEAVDDAAAAEAVGDAATTAEAVDDDAAAEAVDDAYATAEAVDDAAAAAEATLEYFQGAGKTLQKILTTVALLVSLQREEFSENTTKIMTRLSSH